MVPPAGVRSWQVWVWVWLPACPRMSPPARVQARRFAADASRPSHPGKRAVLRNASPVTALSNLTVLPMDIMDGDADT